MNFYTCFLRNFRFLTFAVVALTLQGAMFSASAATYAINGRVYSAARLVPGQPVPNNPLSAVSPEQILKDENLADVGLYAITTKSLVRVSVEKENGITIGSPFLAKYSGGFNFSFTDPAASLKVRLVARDAVTNAKLMESALTTITPAITPAPSVNTRFLLIEADHESMGSPFPGTNLFTMVGRIPNAQNPDATPIIHPVTGLTTVSPAIASTYYIPQYKNAPFGSRLDITGAFSSQYYQTRYCYKVYADGVQLKDPLYKTRYVVTSGGGVSASQVLVGPRTIGTGPGAVADCYEVTPIASATPGQEVFWNLPDMLIRWDTSAISDAVRSVTLKLYDTTTGAQVSLGATAFSALTLHINNQPVVVEFTSITNGPFPGGVLKDMLSPAYACDIVDMSKKLNIIYKAYHPNAAGYLDRYSFSAAPNFGAGYTITDPFAGTSHTGTPVAGASVTLTNAQITHSCAYVLGLYAVARTTDGYWNFNRAYAWKAYYLQ